MSSYELVIYMLGVTTGLTVSMVIIWVIRPWRRR